MAEEDEELQSAVEDLTKAVAKLHEQLAMLEEAMTQIPDDHPMKPTLEARLEEFKRLVGHYPLDATDGPVS